MAVNPQVLKLISRLVPQAGTSSLTRRAVTRGLTRDNPVSLESLVELIARRTPSSSRNVRRNLNFAEDFRNSPKKGPLRGLGRMRLSRQEFDRLSPAQKKKYMMQLRDEFTNSPVYRAGGEQFEPEGETVTSLGDYETLQKLRDALEELL